MSRPVHKSVASARSADRRAHDRESVVTRTVIRAPLSPAPLDVETRDFSPTGCQFVCSEPMPIGTRITLGLVGAGSTMATVVRSEGLAHACVFDAMLTPADTEKAFRGTVVVQLVRAPFATVEDNRLPRHLRMRLLLALGALGWLLPGAFLLLS